MTSSPSVNGANGRDHAGRFATGNSGGPGNPHIQQVAKLRSAMLKAVSEDDLRAIVRALVNKTRRGDVVAAREVLDRCLGKPKQSLDVERDTTPSGTEKSFDQMSDLELIAVIVETGMTEQLPATLRRTVERLYPGRLQELETTRAKRYMRPSRRKRCVTKPSKASKSRKKLKPAG